MSGEVGSINDLIHGTMPTKDHEKYPLARPYGNGSGNWKRGRGVCVWYNRRTVEDVNSRTLLHGYELSTCSVEGFYLGLQYLINLSSTIFLLPSVYSLEFINYQEYFLP